MNDQPFIINNRYEISPALNLVKDRELQRETRMEQRLMTLLCLLAEHKEELVTREVLIKEIWNDYGGADEGLTQSVSALRKVLNDTKKEIIETVPKKGYILHTDAEIVKENAIINPGKKINKNAAPLIAVAIIILAGGLIFYLRSSRNSNQQNRLEKIKDTTVPFSEVNKAPEENYLNTITTTGPDSIQYKLVSIGDRKPLFYINQRLVSEDEMEKYLPLISEMKKQLQKKREMADKQKN